MMRFKLVGMILIISQLFSGCNSCDCDKGSGLEGFYVCDRTDTANQEFLWLFKDNTYIHILAYDTIQFINSDNWLVRDNDVPKLFVAKNWVSPCESGRTYCYERMDYVAKHNFKSYKGGDAQLEFGCNTIGLDDGCYFRLIEQLEPMYNYKRIGGESHKLTVKGKRIEFYTERDSIVFTNTINDRNILSK